MPIRSKIRDLKPRNLGWNMRLRLVRSYDVLDFAGRDIKTVECVFHDETGDKIYAQTKKPWISKHKPMLQEDDDIPEQIKHLLLNRKMLFKIQIKPDENYNYTESFGVRKLISDRAKVSEYAGFFIKNKQESDVYTIGESEVKSNSHKSEVVSDGEVSTPKKAKDKEKPDEDIECKTIKHKLYDEMSATWPSRKAKGIIIKEEKANSP
ncbi:hypothetical protein OROMI_027860 [Orobanche minor]